LLQEVHIVITFQLNWDGGANCKVNCIRHDHHDDVLSACLGF
jgi:hypothetical protein